MRKFILIFSLFLGFINAMHAQEIRITGKVTNYTDDTAIPGVTVTIKGTSSGTITDINGDYELSVAPGSTVVFSYIGMLTEEIVVEDAGIINVSLTPDLMMLKEVTVIGYGTRTRGDLTGAISTVDADVLESRPVTNTLNAIQGVLPGVVVTRGSGRPGQENYQLQIRGYSSKNGNQPLILIDGIPGDLATLNPADIESITVLKDAAAAIYGARSADGVLIVTTKSGSVGKGQITYSHNWANKTPSYVKNMATPYQLARMFDEGRVNDGDPEKYTPEDFELMLNNDPGVGPGRMLYLESFPNFYRNTEWGDVIFKNSVLRSHNLSVNGGTEQIRYLISGGYLDNDGIFAYGENHSKRYNFRTNINMKIRENLKLDTRIGYEHEDIVEPAETEAALSALLQSWSYLPVRNPEGNFYEYQGYANPAQWLEESGQNNTARRKFRANAKLDWELIDGLTFTGQGGVNIGNNSSNGFWRTFTTYNWENQINSIRRQPNFASYVDVNDWYKNLTAYLNYVKLFGNHSVNVMAGASHEEYDFTQKVMEGRQFANNEIYPLNLANPNMLYATSRGLNWRLEDWALDSYFSRFSYSYSGTYYLDVTLRKDGSSKFSPDYRWSNTYPSVALAWTLTQMDFMESLQPVSLLKLRGSWGQTGNQDINALGMYDYIQLLSIGGSYPMGSSNSSVAGATMRGMASPNRTWETITNANVGLDFGFFENKVSGTFDIYQKKNTNMLIDVVFPSVLGAAAPSTNSGELTTDGWEFNLNLADNVGDFSYRIGGNVSYNESILTDLQGADQFNLGLTNFREGYPLFSYFGYQTDGIIQNQQDLDNYSQYAGQGIVPAIQPMGTRALALAISCTKMWMGMV